MESGDGKWARVPGGVCHRLGRIFGQRSKSRTPRRMRYRYLALRSRTQNQRQPEQVRWTMRLAWVNPRSTHTT